MLSAEDNGHLFRRIIIEAVRAVQAGGRSICYGAPHSPHARLRSFGDPVHKTEDRRTIGMTEAHALCPIGRAAE